ncbi:tape measure protein [Synergistes jonesii]|uniref:tape measure protein n=1 Tax=Synergistes jonesii TaxID=2754 RepID=UPI0024317888|nr:tape measure protein [Synergistes jonesii]
MAKVADLLVVISGDSKGLRKELDAAKRNIRSAFGTESMRLSEKVASKFKWIAAGAAALGIASVKMNADMEMTIRAFEVLTGSADKAKEHVAQLEKFAATTPFELPGLLEASKKLQAYGFQTEAVISIMRTVGDAAMSVGLGQEGIDRITLALGQMNAKGKVSAEEMRQLAETGLPAWDMLAKGIGVSVPDAMEMAKKGAIDAKTGITALLTGLDSRFNGMMDKVAGEIPQSFSNMQDSVKSIMRTLGASLTETFDLKAKMKGAADWLGDFAALAKSSGIREALEQMVPDSVKTAIVGISAAVVGIAVPAFGLLAINVIAATWPLLVIGAAFGAAAALIYSNWESVGPFWTKLWDTIVSVTQWAWDKLSSIFTAISDAYHWIDVKFTTFVNKAMSAVGLDIKIGTDVSDVKKEKIKVDSKPVEEAEKKVWSLKEALASIVPTAGGVDKEAEKAAKKAQKSAEAAAKKQQREYERLVEKAKDTSDRIEDEWIEMTGTKMDVLDKWYADEIATLGETKAVNENYQRDLTRLEETYAEKRRKILHDEAKERQRTMEEIVRGYSDIRGELAKGSLEGADLDLYEMRKEAEDSYRGVSDFFAKIAADYADGAEQQKQNIRDALKKAGVEFVQTEKDTLDFTAELNAVHVEKEKQLYDDFVLYYGKCKDVQANIDRAYNNNSFAQLKAALSRENALRLSAFEAQRKAMELYQDSWTKANVSGAEQAIDVLDGTRDSFKTFFSDVLTGAKDFGEAFGDFFKSLWANIVDSFAEKWSNQIVNNLLGNMLGQEGGLLGNLFGFDSSQIQQQIAQETALSSLKIANISAETTAFTAGEATKSTATIAGNEAIAAAAAASLAAQTVASSAAAATIASAWAPAAAAVSLASFGKNAAPAMAGITATHTLSQTLAKGGGGAKGNSVKGTAAFASGGYISGPGSGTSDSIPAMLSNGEYVVRASAVERLGVPFLDRLNYDGTDIFNTVNRFASGGCVGVPVIKSLDMPGFAAGGYVSLADASITVPEFRAEPERIDLAALSVPTKLLKALVAGHTGERRGEAAEMEVNIYGDINNSADEKRLLNKMDAKMRAALMGGY